MPQAHGYAAQSPTTPLAPFTFERRAPGPTDVALDILFCGVCHSDLHAVRDEWGGTVYPSVPGHEIVGRVTAVGDLVSKFKVGELVGVGCMVDSCQHCKPCADGLEQYCDNGFTGTYNGPEQGTGGYANRIVVRESFVLGISHDEKNWQPWRPCSAPVSPPIRRCASGALAPVTRSASSAWAASAIRV